MAEGPQLPRFAQATTVNTDNRSVTTTQTLGELAISNQSRLRLNFPNSPLYESPMYTPDISDLTGELNVEDAGALRGYYGFSALLSADRVFPQLSVPLQAQRESLFTIAHNAGAGSVHDINLRAHPSSTPFIFDNSRFGTSEENFTQPLSLDPVTRVSTAMAEQGVDQTLEQIQIALHQNSFKPGDRADAQEHYAFSHIDSVDLDFQLQGHRADLGNGPLVYVQDPIQEDNSKMEAGNPLFDQSEPENFLDKESKSGAFAVTERAVATHPKPFVGLRPDMMPSNVEHNRNTGILDPPFVPGRVPSTVQRTDHTYPTQGTTADFSRAIDLIDAQNYYGFSSFTGADANFNIQSSLINATLGEHNPVRLRQYLREPEEFVFVKYMNPELSPRTAAQFERRPDGIGLSNSVIGRNPEQNAQIAFRDNNLVATLARGTHYTGLGVSDLRTNFLGQQESIDPSEEGTDASFAQSYYSFETSEAVDANFSQKVSLIRDNLGQSSVSQKLKPIDHTNPDNDDEPAHGEVRSGKRTITMGLVKKSTDGRSGAFTKTSDVPGTEGRNMQPVEVPGLEDISLPDFVDDLANYIAASLANNLIGGQEKLDDEPTQSESFMQQYWGFSKADKIDLLYDAPDFSNPSTGMIGEKSSLASLYRPNPVAAAGDVGSFAGENADAAREVAAEIFDRDIELAGSSENLRNPRDTSAAIKRAIREKLAALVKAEVASSNSNAANEEYELMLLRTNRID